MKQIIGLIAVILTFVAYIPYYRDILRGKTHPHIYSWSLWGILTVLLVALQIIGGAGPSTWVTASAGLLCFGVVFLSLKDGNKNITKSDTITAILSLIAIGFWWFAKQPIVSMILVITADFLAFIPTIRKTWHKPYSETLSLYVTNAFRFFLAIAAIETYTFLSTSWTLFWALGNALFAIMLIFRRKQVKNIEDKN